MMISAIFSCAKYPSTPSNVGMQKDREPVVRELGTFKVFQQCRVGSKCLGAFRVDCSSPEGQPSEPRDEMVSTVCSSCWQPNTKRPRASGWLSTATLDTALVPLESSRSRCASARHRKDAATVASSPMRKTSALGDGVQFNGLPMRQVSLSSWQTTLLADIWMRFPYSLKATSMQGCKEGIAPGKRRQDVWQTTNRFRPQDTRPERCTQDISELNSTCMKTMIFTESFCDLKSICSGNK